MMTTGRINPSGMITHVGGLDSCAETTMNLPAIKGAKKLVYTHISMPMTAIEDFAARAEECRGSELGELYGDLAEICGRSGGLWCKDAEERILRGVQL